MNWGSWGGCYDCSSGVAPGASHLLAWLQEEYSEGRSLGIYNCRPVRGGSSLSIHSCGRAVDWAMPMVDGRGSAAGHAIVHRLGEHGKRLGIQTVIYDRRIWSAKSPEGRPYEGVHPHYDHLHIELTREAGERLTLATLRSVLGTRQEEQVMRRGDKGNAVSKLQQALKGWKPEALPNFGADGDFGAETEEWVKNYQKAAGLQPTGVADGVTVALLMEYMPDKVGSAGVDAVARQSIENLNAHVVRIENGLRQAVGD